MLQDMVNELMDGQMKQPNHLIPTEHPQAEYLRAIADGKKIQMQSSLVTWADCDAGTFFMYMNNPQFEFRIKPEVITGWVNIYNHGKGNTCMAEGYSTKEIADFQATDNRIACIPIQYTPGEGL